MIHLHHDFETFCELNVKDTGAFCYNQHPSCDVLVLTWGESKAAIHTWIPSDDPEVERAVRKLMRGKAREQGFKWVLHTGELPACLVELAEDPKVEFHAHNAQFEFSAWEYVMVRRYGAPRIDMTRYVCTAAACAAAGLPRALEKVGAVLKLDIQKDKEGTRLLNKFAKLQKARKPTKKNPDGVPARRIMPADEPEEFAKLVSYNVTDVLAEMQLPDHVPALSTLEQKYYTLDLRMNARGLPLDMKAVTRAMPILTALEQRVVTRTTELTGGIRPTQRDKMLEFFNESGIDFENLQSKTIKDYLLKNKGDLTDEQAELLLLRVEGGKASTKKLKKMLVVVCVDGRVRGGFLFYGAHTGRWAGKLIQPQNFTRGEYKPHQLEALFEVLLKLDADSMVILYEWPIDAVAQGMRGFIKAPKGKKLVVSDFSAIEARMLAWLAQETEVLKIYRANGDVYIRMASKLYKISEEELLRLCKVEHNPKAQGQRKFAKDIVLGCGYQMGGPGFYKNCVMRGILVEEEECKEAVAVYRKEHPAIVKFWGDVERCAVRAVHKQHTKADPVVLRNLQFYVEDRWFCIRLPSGRVLRYCDPKVEPRERFGRTVLQLSYRTEVKGMWVRESTYGGKLVENITQAVARDVMVESMVRAESRGYPIIGTVHDELIAEVDEDFGSAKELEAIMRILPKWAQDAPVNAEGWEGTRYRK
jgi:DNA polymerase bacteriophage-type